MPLNIGMPLKSSFRIWNEPCLPIVFSFGSFFQQVSNNGWAEGECKGKAGWFPFGYIERRERVLASKVAEVF